MKCEFDLKKVLGLILIFCLSNQSIKTMKIEPENVLLKVSKDIKKNGIVSKNVNNFIILFHKNIFLGFLQ